jgi:hypothetical protein
VKWREINLKFYAMSYITEYENSRERGSRRHIKVDIEQLHEVRNKKITLESICGTNFVFHKYLQEWYPVFVRV